MAEQTKPYAGVLLFPRGDEAEDKGYNALPGAVKGHAVDPIPAGNSRDERATKGRKKMKKIGMYVLAAALLGFFCAGEALGGTAVNSDRGWAAGSSYNRLYNPATVETDSGEVLSVQKIVPMGGMSGGLHFLLKSDKGTISVHLGPAWFLEKKGIKIRPKDHVTVSGSRITFKGKPALIAAEIRKGEKSWRLRDDNGVPLWSRRRGM